MFQELPKSHPSIDRDQIVTYELQVLETSIPQTKPIVSHSHKYSLWGLDSKIKQVTGGNYQNINIRWIGNSSTAYLQTYAYILLIGSGFSQQSTLLFKQSIYKLGRECLDMREQKLLVEFLCLIQYSRDRYSFLNKYPQMEAIFIKILQFVEEDHQHSSESIPQPRKKARVKKKTSPRKAFEANDSANFSSQQLQIQLQLQEVYHAFNSHFQFIKILGSNEYCCSIKVFEEKVIHIVIEKDCYFMLEVQGQNYVSQQIINDFDQVIENHREKIQTRDLLQQYIVQQSCVVPVQRASQIKKPSQETFTTPKFASITRDSPSHPIEQFKLQLKRGCTDHSFIEQLYTNKTPKRSFQQGQSSNNQDSKKKMNKKTEIQEMKAALQKVREKIEFKIKTIDEIQNVKNEIASRKIIIQDQNKVNKQFSPCSHPILFPKKQPNTNSIGKKDRKVSYNQPRPSQKSQNPNLRNRDLRCISKETFGNNYDRVLSEKAGSRPRSKVNSIQGSPPQQILKNQKAQIFEKKKDSLSNMNSPGSLQSNNVNVNVNVSISQSPVVSLNNQYANKFKIGSYKKYLPVPSSPPSRVPSKQFLHPFFIRSPRSSKQLISNEFFPARVPSNIVNPERSVVKSRTSQNLTKILP